MNNRNQPIYDNKKLKDAGKYNFENVNAINKRSGEMEFDHTLENKKERKHNAILITSIISGVLILLTCVVAFTDLKYLIFPKKQEILEENFEGLDVIHEMICRQEIENNAMKTITEKIYTYNNAKLKTVKYLSTIEIIANELKNEEIYTYLESSMNETLSKYSNEKGLDISYTKKDNVFQLIQESDLKEMPSTEKQIELFNVYLDKNIESIRQMDERNGFKCEQK